MLKQLVDMRKKLVDLEQQERIARELEHQRNALTLLGVVSQTAQKTKGRLRVTNLELTDFQSQPAIGAAGCAGGAARRAASGGRIARQPAVAELVDGLEQSAFSAAWS